MNRTEIIEKLIKKCASNAGAVEINQDIVYSGKFDFTNHDDVIEMKAVMITNTGVKFDVYHYGQKFERTTISFSGLTEETLIRILEIIEDEKR